MKPSELSPDGFYFLLLLIVIKHGITSTHEF